MRQRGLSLIELMISMALGLVIVLAAITLLTGQSQQLRDQVQKTILQENGRISLDLIGAHIRLAGFYGTMDEGDGLTNTASQALAAGTGCTDFVGNNPNTVSQDPRFAATHPNNQAQDLVIREYTTVAEVAATYSCIPNSDVAVTSAILEIRSVDGVPVTPSAGASPPNDGYYVQASPGGGQLFFGNTDYDALVAGFQDSVYTDGVTPVEVMRWEPAVYYVKPCATVGGNCTGTAGTPVLARQRLMVPSIGAAPRMAEEILIEGVEHIEYMAGIADAGQIDRFVPIDDVPDWDNVLAIRVAVVVRELVAHDNPQTLNATVTLPSGAVWNCGSSTTDACDHDRTLYTGTFNIRNRLL